MLTQDKIECIFSVFEQQNPTPKTELEYTNPYTLLVAVALSAQATDVGVNKATKALFQLVSAPQQMLDLGLENLTAYVKSIGLYKTKARHIIAAAEILVRDHGGQVPDCREDLEALPGVGRKTANVVLNVAFGHPTLAVDTHIFRVSNRLGLTCGKNPLQVEQQLEKVLPEAYKHHAHHWLILHGRYVCKARSPQCSSCKISQWCESATVFLNQHS
jgi:endonuclease-3